MADTNIGKPTIEYRGVPHCPVQTEKTVEKTFALFVIGKKHALKPGYGIQKECAC